MNTGKLFTKAVPIRIQPQQKIMADISFAMGSFCSRLPAGKHQNLKGVGQGSASVSVQRTHHSGRFFKAYRRSGLELSEIPERTYAPGLRLHSQVAEVESRSYPAVAISRRIGVFTHAV